MSNVTNVRRLVWTNGSRICVQDPPCDNSVGVAEGVYTMTTFTGGDTTPSVTGNTMFRTNNSGATTITYFDNGEGTGHRITILINDNYTTIAHDTTKIRMPGGKDYNFQQYQIVTFILLGSVWICEGVTPKGE